MKTSFINNNLNSQPILIKFALKFFVCKCLSFQTHLLLDLRFPLNHLQKSIYKEIFIFSCFEKPNKLFQIQCVVHCKWHFDNNNINIKRENTQQYPTKSMPDASKDKPKQHFL